MSRELTEKQRQILQFIVESMDDTGVTPTMREIASRFGFSAPASVRRHLDALEKKGYIRRHEGRARGIEPIKDQVRRLFWQRTGIPLVGQVAAGTPILAEENIEDVLQLGGLFPMEQGLFALRVKGDSMIEAGILEGDLLVVRPQPTADVGDIVVAMLGDEGTVKRFGRAGDHIRLEPANKDYFPIITRDARVVGVVVGLVRHL
ncbi:transcriptional repressor LexA [Candidatus Acetothermia bacterium]|nr:transcriptional repressor LexA [Candidatus Acetothermia bacterium]MBI3642791.1 transcriptional repressor LexA [Candidatus Acetothermia bacterium]